MKFYLYHRPLLTIKFKEFIGDLVHVSPLKKDFSPDGEKWDVLEVIGPATVYDRLVRMLAAGGMTPDEIYPLDGNRRVEDLIKFMKTWR